MAIKLLEALKKPKTNSTPQKTSSAKATSDSSGNGSKKASSQSTTKYVDDVLFDFNKEDKKSTSTTQKNANQSQEQILAKLRAAGLKTTRINKNETDFAQYTAALSDKLKKEIIDSYDCEADYILQQEVLGLFKNHNCIKNGRFASSLEKMGYTVTRKSEKTTYLTDWKKGRNSSYITGHISVYTITDPKTGAEIKIADTNGNGAIEVEEVVANEFLTGISAQIDVSNFKNSVLSGSDATGGLFSNGVSGSSGNALVTSDEEGATGEDYSSDGKLKLNERQYKLLKEKVVKEFEAKGYEAGIATSKANSKLKEKCMVFDGAKNVSDLDGVAQSIAA